MTRLVGSSFLLWESVQPNSRVGRIFGIGLSDPHFVLASCGSRSFLMPDSRMRSKMLKLNLKKNRHPDKSCKINCNNWNARRSSVKKESNVSGSCVKKWSNNAKTIRRN